MNKILLSLRDIFKELFVISVMFFGVLFVASLIGIGIYKIMTPPKIFAEATPNEIKKETERQICPTTSRCHEVSVSVSVGAN
ncbi:MAG: hypothetical protein KAR24_03380 [Candidatus Pacebacteria bacterium]|nr:hypothetical protein [Candidatus Paceibacterota bacterium]